MEQKHCWNLKFKRGEKHDFEYQSKIYLGEVALYVADLAKQKDFYQRILGLDLLEEQDGQVAFGQGRTSSGETLSDQWPAAR